MNPIPKKTSIAQKTPALTTSRDVLAVIREFFTREVPDEEYDQMDAERRKLWAVLAALRGPDNADPELKRETTAVIRHEVLGRRLHGIGVVVEPDSKLKADRRYARWAGEAPGGGHFLRHARQAFDALDLYWDVSNFPKTKE